MFEVLMFIFENYMDGNVSLRADTPTMVVELETVGFTRQEIELAIDWLEGLDRFQTGINAGGMVTSNAIRHYVAEETEQLGREGKGFLLYLEQLGILDSATREMVIDRVMALDYREVDLGRIKWVVLMVLFSQPEKKSTLSLLQDMILSDAFDLLH